MPAQRTDLLMNRIAHYPMDNGALDISGYENHGQVNGAILTIDRSGIASQAYSLDGENDYINCGAGIEGISSQVTVSCWIRTSETTGSGHILSKYDFESDAGFILGFQDGKAMWAGRNGSDQYIRLTSGAGIGDGQWHQLIGIIEGNSWSIFVDGILENQIELSNRRTSLGNSQALIIGMHYQNNNTDRQHYKGDIDEVIIYNRALNACEIEMLYTGNRGVR